MGAKTSCPERILGAHFFSPAHIMPLLEIVRTDKTSKQVRLWWHIMTVRSTCIVLDSGVHQSVLLMLAAAEHM